MIIRTNDDSEVEHLRIDLSHPVAARETISTPQQNDEPPTSFSPGRFPSPSPFYPDAPGLFLQTGATVAEVATAAALIREEGTGIVLTANVLTKDYTSALTSASRTCALSAGPGAQILADANRYAGKNRRIATATGTNLSREWIEAQKAAGLPVALTDSPYIPARAAAALRKVLHEASRFGPGVMAVLPLHLDWLKHDTELLINIINEAGAPVALVLESSSDPLGVQGAVAGLTQLLARATVKVSLLRSDISVIGAVAFGATFAAVGSSTSMRHLYPVKKKSGGGGQPAQIGVFVPRSMAYRSISTLNTAMALDDDHPERWRCNCRFCYSRPLSRIVDELGAFQHSAACIAALGENILAGATPLVRQHKWLGDCQHAQTTNLEIMDETGMRWEPPKFQGAWVKLRSTLPPLPTT